MNEIVIKTPETTTLEDEAGTFIQTAESIQVTTADEHGIALESIRDIRQMEKRITEHFEPSRKALDVAKKEVLAARDKLVKPLTAARGILNDKAVTYQQEQERIAAEAQRKADEEARIAREKAEAEAKAAEKARLAALEEAIDSEDEEAAEEILAADPEPVQEIVPVVVEAPAIAKVAGASTRTTWKAEVVDKMALIQYVAANPEWEFLLDASLPGLNRIAVSQKDQMNVPGVKAVSSSTVVTR